MSDEGRMEWIKYRLTHSLPISVDQSRWLFEKATGTVLQNRKRCPECEGAGKTKQLRWHTEKHIVTLDSQEIETASFNTEECWIECAKCRGSGYTV